jgi:hypothetical protein
VGGVNSSMNRPVPPRDEDREQLHADLTRLVGAGRLQFEEFDRLTEVVWSTHDKSVLDRIRVQYLTYHPPQAQQPQQFQTPAPQQPPHPPQQHLPQHYPGDVPGLTPQPMPMAQPGAEYRPVPAHTQPVVSTMGEVKRTGVWTVPAYSSFKLNGATLKLDLRQAQAEAPVCTFDIQATIATVEIIVPPGVYVENRLSDTWSSMTIDTSQPHPNAPRVVLTGAIRGSSLKVVTKPVSDPNSVWNRLFGH